MSDDLISRQAALSLPRRTIRNFRGEVVEETINVEDVMALPSAQPERKWGEAMGRYIDADILAKIVFDKWQEHDELKHIIPAIRNAIMCASTADVRENVHAHWEGDGQCSNCKDYPLARYMRNPNFCPNCGAQMDERGEDE